MQVQDVQRPSDCPVPRGRTQNRGAGLGAGPRQQGALSPDEVTPTFWKEHPAGFEKPGEEGKVVGRRDMGNFRVALPDQPRAVPCEHSPCRCLRPAGGRLSSCCVMMGRGPKAAEAPGAAPHDLCMRRSRAPVQGVGWWPGTDRRRQGGPLCGSRCRWSDGTQLRAVTFRGGRTARALPSRVGAGHWKERVGGRLLFPRDGEPHEWKRAGDHFPLLWGGECRGLNACVPQEPYVDLYPQCDGIERWGSWGVVR